MPDNRAVNFKTIRIVGSFFDNSEELGFENLLGGCYFHVANLSMYGKGRRV